MTVEPAANDATSGSQSESSSHAGCGWRQSQSPGATSWTSTVMQTVLPHGLGRERPVALADPRRRGEVVVDREVREVHVELACDRPGLLALAGEAVVLR